jgi:hypothetical protein
VPVLAALVDPVVPTGRRSLPEAVLAALARVAAASGRIPVILGVGALAVAGQLGG